MKAPSKPVLLLNVLWVTAMTLSGLPEAWACASHGKAASPDEIKRMKAAWNLKPLGRFPAAESLIPPTLPSPEGKGSLSPWGGPEGSRWRPEAILANAFSTALNEAWKLPGAVDVTVAVPTQFSDSGYHPYGDGQSNSKMTFNDAWGQSRPQLVATLIRFKNGTSEVRFKLDRTLQRNASAPAPKTLEVLRSVRGALQRVNLPLTRSASGDLSAVWTNVPQDLDWGNAFQNHAVLVRLQPAYSDWLPVFFRMPVRTADGLIARTPPSKRKFSGPMSDLSLVDANGKYQDPLGVFSQAKSSNRSAFDVLMSLRVPAGYNQNFYNPKNIHAEYGPGGIVTGVGQGWTWVAEDRENRPFKIMYTCFERRQPGAEASARDGGVTSGGGWHSINNRTPGVDPDVPVNNSAEIIVNSLERSSLVVAGGYVNVPARTGLTPPSGETISYNLSDVAVARWLRPGEGFVTAAGTSQPNHHWYFFHQPQEVCTEEWVGQCGVDFACD